MIVTAGLRSRSPLHFYSQRLKTMKKILILSVSAGQGHVRAAESLVAGTTEWFNGGAVARHVDLMSLCPPWFSTAYKGAYLKFVGRFPSLWGMLYSRTDIDRAEGLMGQLRRRLESQVSKPLQKIIDEYQPDILISTHFLPGQVLARWLRRGRIEPRPHWIVVTDFLAHRFWLEPEQSGYFVAGEETAFTMQKRGLEKERFIISGIPIMPEFSRSLEKGASAAAFGLDASRPVVVLMGGGEGVGLMKDIAAELINLDVDFQLLALAGRNAKLFSDLKKMSANRPGRLFPQGFTDEMPKLLTGADLVITKPGGLTTSECLALGRPMIAISPIPGQEEANSDYLLENGAALKATSLPSLTFKARKLLNDSQKLERLGGNALKIGKPLAAKTILDTVLQ